MPHTDIVGQTTLRIPGNWSHPSELLERLPQGVHLTPEALVLPDGVQVEFTPMPPDDQFAAIFKSCCRRQATSEEMAIVDGYTVNVGLTGPGGSMQAALTMLQAGAAIVRAGGAGVFIDNSGVAHGGQQWLELTEDGSPDAVSFAFVGIVRGRQEVWTMGMQVLGLPDVMMRRADADADDGGSMIELIRYLATTDHPVQDGHLLADEAGGLRFHVSSADSDEFGADSPMHNRFGRLKLTSIKDIAENN
ncbi:MAG: hypothetical protein NXI32_30650 [bacterium]|nr:hypothetical protein [bacterium]